MLATILFTIAMLLNPAPAGCTATITTLHEDEVPGRLVQFERITDGLALAVTCEG